MHASKGIRIQLSATKGEEDKIMLQNKGIKCR